MKKKLQKILNDAGYKHIKVIDKNHVQTNIDGEQTIFSISDRYGGHPLSGWANFGPVGGDHRMIRAIAEDIEYCFNLITNKTPQNETL